MKKITTYLVARTLVLATFFGASVALADADRAIENAKNLSLQRERVQAARVLREAILTESLDSPELQKKKKFLNKITEMFYTSKAMQAYELAVSVGKTKPQEARASLIDSLKEEVDNVKVLTLLSEIDLRSGDCESSLSWANRGLEINPFLEDLVVRKAQALGCTGDRAALLSWIAQKESLRKNVYGQFAEIQVYVQGSDWEEAEQLLEKTKSKHFPEWFYLKAIVEKAQKKDAYLESFAKYVHLCEDVDSLQKKFALEPRLCSEAERVKKTYELPPGSTVQKIVK